MSLSPSLPHNRAAAALLLGAPLLFGLAWYCPPGQNLGDICDHRFNMFIMEHGYQWLIGQVPRFWDADIFFPASANTIAFSDHHVGNLPLYALVRTLGLGREAAMAAWMAAVCALNYAAAAWVLVRLTGSALGAAMGAYFFAFGMPMIGQAQHPQLFPRYFVPLAVWYLLQAIASQRTWPLVALGLMVVGQLYTGMYIGIFLVEVLACLALAQWLYPGTRAAFTAWLLPRALAPWLLRLGLLFGAALALLPVALPYLRAFHQLGGRSWPLVISMVFTPLSLILPPNHTLLWSQLEWFVPFQGTHGEHRAFIGASLLGLALIYARLRRSGHGLRDETLLWTTLIGVLIAGLLTSRLSKTLSLYWFLYLLPGVGSLRAITRIMLVLQFPLALLLALTTRALADRAALLARPWLQVALGPALLVLLALDQLVVDYPRYPVDADAARIAGYVEELRQQPPGWKAFAIVGPAFIVNATDSLLVAQDSRRPTASGYSGNFPANWSFPTDVAHVAAWLAACNQAGSYGPPLQLADIAILRQRE